MGQEHGTAVGSSISSDLYIKCYLCNERGTREMYKTRQTPGTDAWWGGDSITKSDHSLRLLGACSICWFFGGIINERAEGTRSQIMKKHTHTQRKITMLGSNAESDLLTAQLHNQQKVTTEESFY